MAKNIDCSPYSYFLHNDITVACPVGVHGNVARFRILNIILLFSFWSAFYTRRTDGEYGKKNNHDERVWRVGVERSDKIGRRAVRSSAVLWIFTRYRPRRARVSAAAVATAAAMGEVKKKNPRVHTIISYIL